MSNVCRRAGFYYLAVNCLVNLIDPELAGSAHSSSYLSFTKYPVPLISDVDLRQTASSVHLFSAYLNFIHQIYLLYQCYVTFLFLKILVNPLNHILPDNSRSF